ncbi:unnamed protein product, partial [Rotaria magnacalcarata]
EIREAYEELSTLERQARIKTSASSTISNIQKEDDLDILLEQLHTLEQRLDQTKMFPNESLHRNKKPLSPTIVAQFDELDQALATLTNTLNNVEIELGDSGNSSSSSAVSDSTTIHHHQRHKKQDDKHPDIEGDEHFSDSGLSQSTDSISLPLKQRSQLRTNSQISNASSVVSCDTLKNFSGENKILVALEKMQEANIKKISMEKIFSSLDRLKTSQKHFMRSSSFHDSLRRSIKSEQNLMRTCSISPPNLSTMKANDCDLKRSKSTKEMTSKSAQTSRSKSTNKKDHHETTRSSSTSSIIPFIHQCIQPEKTMDDDKPPLPPPKRPPPPVPRKNLSLNTPSATTVDNHIYDSFQDSPSLTNNCQRICSCTKTDDIENSIVSKPHLPPMRVTDL